MQSRFPILLALAFWPIAGLLDGAGINPLPGMPQVIDPNDIYSETHVGKISPTVRSFRDLIYVPNSDSNTVDVVDPLTFRIVNHFKVRRQPQHVTPSYDLKTLWVLSDLGDSLTKIDPAMGTKGETIRVKDPYNMYYTPDGKFAIVVGERVHRLDFRNPSTMALVDTVPVPCRGVDHMDFSADGRYLIASCEFSGSLIKLDVAKRALVGMMALAEHEDRGAMSQPTVPAHATRGLSMRRAYDLKHTPAEACPKT